MRITMMFCVMFALGSCGQEGAHDQAEPITQTALPSLSWEQPLARMTFQETGPQRWSAELWSPRGSPHTFALEGDEWRLHVLQDATSFRLDRLETRYRATDQPLPMAFDLGRNYQWMPIDSRELEGSGAFMPMANDAQFEMRVTRDGLIVRPLNEAALQASEAAWGD